MSLDALQNFTWKMPGYSEKPKDLDFPNPANKIRICELITLHQLLFFFADLFLIFLPFNWQTGWWAPSLNDCFIVVVCFLIWVKWRKPCITLSKESLLSVLGLLMLSCHRSYCGRKIQSVPSFIIFYAVKNDSLDFHTEHSKNFSQPPDVKWKTWSGKDNRRSLIIRQQQLSF